MEVVFIISVIILFALGLVYGIRLLEAIIDYLNRH